MEWKSTFKEWENFENLDKDVRAQMSALKSDEDKEDAFGATMSFGTAGMRGFIGAGPNRMNIYTVRQATEGVAKLLNQADPKEKAKGVVIAYDNRNYSPEFAMEAAKVLGFHGIKTYLFDSLRPTPELSFAIRHLGTANGIVITASHNPAAYNGYKIYGSDGGQMPPEDADNLTKFIREIDNPLTVEVGDEKTLRENGTITIIGEEVDKAYLNEMKAVTINEDLVKEWGPKINITFTPLHGTGVVLGPRALQQAHFTNIHKVEEQLVTDGDFPTVVSPNPESPGAFDMALELGIKEDSDIILATDPDADRLGAMIRVSKGEYKLLTGNQIASLMIDYILNALKAQGELPENGVVVKSIVSTKLADKILESYGLEIVEVLTGFKFIAEKIHEYEQTGKHTFLMGFEESYGYLVKPFARDKDAIQALVVLAELTAFHKSEGRTLADALEAIYKKHGYFKEVTISIDFPGLSGKEKMANIMKHIREESLTSIAGEAVVKSEDYLTGKAVDVDGNESTLNYPSSDALRYTLADGSWVAFRPSGTEPKIKLYLGVTADTKEAVEEKAKQIEADMRKLTE